MSRAERPSYKWLRFYSSTKQSAVNITARYEQPWDDEPVRHSWRTAFWAVSTPCRGTDSVHNTVISVNLVDCRSSCFNRLKQWRSNLPIYLEGWVSHEPAALQPYYEAEQCKLCLMHSSCVFHLPALLGCQNRTRLSQRTTALGKKHGKLSVVQSPGSISHGSLFTR